MLNTFTGRKLYLLVVLKALDLVHLSICRSLYLQSYVHSHGHIDLGAPANLVGPQTKKIEVVTAQTH